MTNRARLAPLLTLAIAALFIATGAPAARAESRPQPVLRGLDYLHAQQDDNGGFGSMPDTSWALLAIVACGERADSAAWKIAGKGPFIYLDTRSHEAAATSYDVDNAPVYYAQVMMAYVAAQHADRVYIAGQPRIDLLAKLYLYQDVDDGPTGGSFSPSSSNRDFQAVRTTTWAILALRAVKEDGKARFNEAVSWLTEQQLADGGFPSGPTAGAVSSTLDTALAIQALRLGEAGAVDPSVLSAARLFLKSRQRADGGFAATATGGTDAQVTAASIQAILALGERPDDAYWTVGTSTPLSALKGLQLRSGAIAKRRGSTAELLPTTAWALIALRAKPFTTFPSQIGSAVTPFTAQPRITSASPKNGTRYTTTTSVTIAATYSDGANGTGVNPAACRVYVDGGNKTTPAVIGRYSLRLRLSSVANGTHTYKLRIVDYAGNAREVQRSFTMAVAAAPAATPTSVWPPYTPSTPKPVTTLTPGPAVTSSATPVGPSPSTSGAPVSGVIVTSPSPSGSPTATVVGGDPTGYLVGTMLALLPIGATAAYLLHRRRTALLDAAHEGKTLPSQGSGWQQLTKRGGAA